MGITANIVPVDNPDTTLIRIPAGHIPNFPEDEPGALAHWMFKTGDSRGLADLKSGLLVTPSGVPPTYPGPYVQFPGGAPSGLLTPFDDNDSGTDIVVFKYEARNDQSTIIFGSQLGGGVQGGEVIDLLPAGSLRSQVRGYVTNGAVNNPANIVNQQWLMVGVVRTPTIDQNGNVTQGTRQPFICFGGAVIMGSVVSGVKILANPMRKYALGNAYRNSVGYQEVGMKIAEYIRFSGPRVQSELLATYNNSVARLSRAGVPLA